MPHMSYSWMNFRELRQRELRRIHLPRTSVNKARRKWRGHKDPATSDPLRLSRRKRASHHPMGLLRQFFEKAIEVPRIFEPVKESFRGGANQYLLAVGGDHVYAIRSHPVEATTARHYVLRRGIVIGQDDVVAVSGAENVLGRFYVGVAPEHVVTFLAHQAVGAGTTGDEVVARTA